jgi:Family of unknown function (DUF6221)
MTDLVAFLRARLDEDEAAARPLIGMPGALTAFGAVAEFIARTEPARVLREVEAKRAILGYHRRTEWAIHGNIFACHQCRATAADEDVPRFTDFAGYDWLIWPCPTLRHLAAVYQDHPDFDPAWVTASG